MAPTITSAFLISFFMLFFIRLLRGLLVTPVHSGKNTTITTVVRCENDCGGLEQTVNGLLWLSGSGMIRMNIVIIDAGMDDDSRELAERIADTKRGVYLCIPEDLETLI